MVVIVLLVSLLRVKISEDTPRTSGDINWPSKSCKVKKDVWNSLATLERV